MRISDPGTIQAAAIGKEAEEISPGTLISIGLSFGKPSTDISEN